MLVTIVLITLSLVPAKYAICGKNITLGPVVIPASDIPCHLTESFYTWHPLRGINTDILMLFVDGLLFFMILVLIESKVVYRIAAVLKDIIPGYYTYQADHEDLDDDVLKEQERVVQENNSDVLRVFQLQKKYRRLE